jgi:hypothetical protein
MRQSDARALIWRKAEPSRFREAKTGAHEHGAGRLA